MLIITDLGEAVALVAQHTLSRRKAARYIMESKIIYFEDIGPENTEGFLDAIRGLSMLWPWQLTQAEGCGQDPSSPRNPLLYARLLSSSRLESASAH